MRVCLILGGAECLWNDLAAFKGPWDGLVACNEAGAACPGELDGFATLHPHYWLKKGWLAQRTAAGFPPAKRLFAHDRKEVPQVEAAAGVAVTVTPWLFPGQAWPDASITSGIFAAKVALVDLGFDLGIFCGIPMTETPHFFDAEPWKTATRYAKRLPNIPAEYRNRLRSMSGATRDFFGAPD